MSIIVKGINAPERCETCTMAACYRNSGSIWCNAMNRRLVPDWDGDTEVEIDVPEWCPIIEVTGPLIDRNNLEKAVLKWMPHDPCGKQELERPFETDICVSMMMEIEEQEVIADVDRVRTDSTSE